jgi:glycosyltransferase involved in cell wall biosynthesis
MKKKIFYWSPCLSHVGTVISTLNSAIALSKYSNEFDVSILNVCGEWDKYNDQIEKNSINLINLNFKYFKYLPKTGYVGSRFSYIVIFIFSFIPLLRIIRFQKPEVLILHLITSLPLFLQYLFNFKTKFILRISGYPKLNFFRKFFWKKISKKLELTTCPTIDLKSYLIKNKIFNENKITFLPDAILDYSKLKKVDKKFSIIKDYSNNKIILSVGRLTKQKNFVYLINEFYKFNKVNKDYVLFIVGEGEERENLEKTIRNLELKDKVFLIGHRSNIYDYMRNSEIFVLSSLWESPGFVIIEAAINNLFIISSDCPTGPKEFLNDGKNGLLFKNNVNDELFKTLLKFSELNSEKKFKDKLKLKKYAINYSKFKHYIKLKKILGDLQ